MVILDNSKNVSPSGLPRGVKTKVVSLLSQSWAGLRFYFWVKGMQSRTARRAALGKRVVFSKRARVVGWKCVRIGSNTVVSDDTWILANHPDSSVKIGESCFVGLRNFFTASERIELGDFCMTAPGCGFLGASHRRCDPLTPYVAASVKKEGSIVIGTNCSIGAGVLILADSVVGHGSVLGAGAVVKGFFPPFSLLVGNPARVARRFDFLTKLWVAPEDLSVADGHPLYCEEVYREEVRRSWAGFRAFPSMATVDFGSF